MRPRPSAEVEIELGVEDTADTIRERVAGEMDNLGAYAETDAEINQINAMEDDAVRRKLRSLQKL